MDRNVGVGIGVGGCQSRQQRLIAHEVVARADERLRQGCDRVGVEGLVGDEIGADAERGQVGVRHWRIAPQCSERNVEALIGAFHIGNGAGGLHRNQGRKGIMAVAEKAPHQRQVFFVEGNDHQERAGLFRLDRARHIRRRDALEIYLVGEVIFLFQGIDDLLVDLAADHANRMPLQLLDAAQRRTRQGQDHQHRFVDQHNGSRLGEIADIGTNDGEVGLSGGKQLCGIQHAARRHDLDPHGRLRRIQPAGDDRGDFGCLAVERSDRKA